jgi:hypothetical protein
MDSEFDDLVIDIDIRSLADVDPSTMLDILQSAQSDVGPLHTAIHDDSAQVNPVEFQYGDQSAHETFSLFTRPNDVAFEHFGSATIEEIPDSVPTEMSSTEIVPFENVPVTATQEDSPKRRLFQLRWKLTLE